MPENAPSIHRVLFVDDEAAFLDVMARQAARWSKGTWEVQTASTTAQALTILQDQRIDLAVLDVRMPVVDGMQFLQLLHRKYPNLQLVIMTGYGDEHQRNACLENGAVLFLEKPRTPEGFDTVFATLNELAALQPQEGFRGVLRTVGLQDVLQMECLGRGSSILEISNANVRGKVFIHSGAIIHAELGDKKGEPAFNELLALRGGEFNLKPYAEPRERTIDAQWEFLLMEAARMHDEAQEQRAAAADIVPSVVSPVADLVTAHVEPAPAPAQPVPDEIPEEVPTCIEEMLVWSPEGEVLYQWQCAGIEARLKLFEFIYKRASQLGLGLPLGRFDRLEILTPEGRMVAQVQPDRRLFVRVRPAKAAAAA